MRMMALDVGEKTVGVAVSDELGITVSPRETVRRNGSELDRIEHLVRDEDIGEVVVGLPVSMSGDLGTSAQRVMEFIEQLRARVMIPVVTCDERLTTAEAEKMLISANVRRARRRQVIDQVAATLILQAHLARRAGADHGGEGH